MMNDAEDDEYFIQKLLFGELTQWLRAFLDPSSHSLYAGPG